MAEPFLMRMAHGAPIRTSNSKEKITGLRSKCQNQLGITNNTSFSDEQALRVCKRFYVALILSRLVQVFFPIYVSYFLSLMELVSISVSYCMPTYVS